MRMPVLAPSPEQPPPRLGARQTPRRDSPLLPHRRRPLAGDRMEIVFFPLMNQALGFLQPHVINTHTQTHSHTQPLGAGGEQGLCLSSREPLIGFSC